MNDLESAVRAHSLADTAAYLAAFPNDASVPLPGSGLLPALFAAAEGSAEILRYFVEYSRSSLDIYDDGHRNILHYAVESGDPERCRYLIERCGMDPLAADRELLTPYELAYELSRGIDAHAKMPAGRRTVPGESRRAVYELLMEKAGAPFEKMYKNPIRRGFFPDPSVVAVGEDFYMVNSSFIFFPCIPISHSRDLVHWEIIGYAVTDPEAAGLDSLEGGRGFWAPDISYDSGTFYITATYRLNDGGPVLRRQMVVSSDKPEGPYSAPVFIEEDGIDPSLFHEDGRHYMLLNRGARLIELSEDCKRQTAPARLLYYGSMKHAPEGSHLLKKDGFYYLFQAEGGTGPGHRITVARSRTLFGVYEPCPYNPIMRQTDPEAAIQRCGHGKPVMGPDGSWYMVYLCGRSLDGKYSVLGRETALDPVTWTADGWPVVNGLKGPSALQVMPSFRDGSLSLFESPQRDSKRFREPSPKASKILKEPSPSSPASLPWLTPRPPVAGGVTRNSDGTVTLLSSPAPLKDVAARNILLLRQDRFDFTAKAVLALPALATGAEAGIIGFYDENSWVLSAVYAREDGSYGCRTTEHIGHEDIVHEDPAVRVPGGADVFIFTMETQGLARRFRIEAEDGTLLHEAFLPDVYYLSDEGVRMGKRFTGAMLGAAAQGGSEPYFYTLKEFTVF